MEGSPSDCLICRKQRGAIVIPGGAIYVDDVVYVGHLAPANDHACLGYLMMETRWCVAGLAGISAAPPRRAGRRGR